ncbi:MAG: ABC transporter permease subunit [Anaerolineae bacterium]|nr:ABC transporter permease subunit [Anaerolineae bacterium]
MRRWVGAGLLNVVLGLGLFYLLWLALGSYLDNEVVPLPPAVWEAAQSERVQAELPGHLEVSTRRILRALALSTLLALPLGLVLGQSRLLNRLLAPLLALTYAIPKVVLLPVVLILYGTGDASKVALIVLVLFFQILVVVRDAALNIPGELLESVRSLGAGRRALYWYVYLPASLGAVLTAWRVSVGTAVAVLFIAETTATREGLGYYIVNNSQRLRYPEMYVGILAMSALGVALYLVTDILERLLGRWKA